MSRAWALLGAVIGVVSGTIGLALAASPPSLSGGLFVLAESYRRADVAGRVALGYTAEGLAAAANAVSPAGILTALGIFLLSLLMLKGPFARITAILGIVTGVSGIFLESFRPLVGGAYALYGILLPAWFIAVALGIGRVPERSRLDT